MDVNLSKLQETVKDRGAWRAAVLMWSPRARHDLATEQPQSVLLPIVRVKASSENHMSGQLIHSRRVSLTHDVSAVCSVITCFAGS